MAPKMEFFNFGLEQKLDHHSSVEFHSDSDGDGFKAHFKSDLVGDPNKPQEGSHKTSSAFVSN